MQKTLKSLVHRVAQTLVAAAHSIDDVTREPRRLAQSMVEYAIIAAVIAIIALAAVKGLGGQLTDTFAAITTQVSDAAKPGGAGGGGG